SRQPHGVIVDPGDCRATCRSDQEPPAFDLVGGEFGGPLKRLCGSRVPGPSLGASCGLLERPNYTVVGLDHGGGEMPGASIGIGSLRPDRGESRVRRPALARRRCAVHRRADERMPEIEPCTVDGKEAGPLGDVERNPAVAEASCCGEDDSEILRVVRSSYQQEKLCLLWKLSDALEEDALDLACERQRLRQRRVSCELSLRER